MKTTKPRAPRPGRPSLARELDVVDSWGVALDLARAGDVHLLVRFLKPKGGIDASWSQVPADVRAFLADVIEGVVTLQRRAGNPGKLDAWDRAVIQDTFDTSLLYRWTEPSLDLRTKIGRARMVRFFAEKHGVSEATIRDIARGRRGYSRADK